MGQRSLVGTAQISRQHCTSPPGPGTHPAPGPLHGEGRGHGGTVARRGGEGLGREERTSEKPAEDSALPQPVRGAERFGQRHGRVWHATGRDSPWGRPGVGGLERHSPGRLQWGRGPCRRGSSRGDEDRDEMWATVSWRTRAAGRGGAHSWWVRLGAYCLGEPQVQRWWDRGSDPAPSSPQPTRPGAPAGSCRDRGLERTGLLGRLAPSESAPVPATPATAQACALCTWSLQEAGPKPATSVSPHCPGHSGQAWGRQTPLLY